MLTRELRHLVPFVAPLLVLLFVCLRFYDGKLIALPFQGGYSTENAFADSNGQHSNPSHDGLSTTTSNDDSLVMGDDIAEIISGSGLTTPSSEHTLPPSGQTQGLQENNLYHEVFSASTADRKYFMIEFGDRKALNPNIIPHPRLNYTWIIVAQHSVEMTMWFAELVCNAAFKDGVLGCINSTAILPISATFGDKCEGNLAHFNLNIGPHDARVFYGPKSPYTIYGSNSHSTCFGQWIQDFRLLVDWGLELSPEYKFRVATELQRPAPYRPIEKNFFVFWDKYGQIYGHYDITPKRVFAKLENDGSVGQDLAPLAAASDEKCMAKYMPKFPPEAPESIHQATNSLSITLCKRTDRSCEPNDSNTFILSIFQHKKYYSFHGVYEPYVMLFQQAAPFAVYGISTKPIWIHGRKKSGEARNPNAIIHEEPNTWNQTEMFYITSLSWKTQGQKYHGHIDDVLFLAFGIEDHNTGGIDVVAGDLLGGLGLCITS